MIRKIVCAAVPEPPPGLFSNCLIAGGFIHVSGQHAGGPGGAEPVDASVGGQTRIALQKIQALLAAAGAEMADVVKLTIYLTDMSARAEVSAARRAFFTGDFPCSTLVGVAALVAPGLKVEIDALAVLRAG